ncbi:MAG: sigma-54-dependent Fis family transcriptional regulator [Magnetococcales bacterium]|nr:sigma-54-dependent Fis family transcriptional regulator [Magnetococcales bacterium]
MNPSITQPVTVLLVDDEQGILLGAQSILVSAGIMHVEILEDSRRLIPFLESTEVSILILDLFMPNVSGTELLPEIRRRFPDIAIIIMTASMEVETAVACMKEGIFDYLVKPVEMDRLLSIVKKALELTSMRMEVLALKRSLLSPQSASGEIFKEIVTQSRKMEALFQYMTATSVTNEPILILGETGVGKEMIANAIHELSGRQGKFVTINVAGLDDTVFTDTLFGHKKGSFTGAVQAREGIIAKARNGTLFLDEIGDLSELSQVKLLRVLQEHEYYPMGSDLPIRTNARIILATNLDLKKKITQGKFRADLYYRLSVHEIEIPPLRDRKEDIVLLTNHFLELASRAMGKPVPTPPKELFSLLMTYHFPGNIRELRAMVFDAVAQHGSRMISMKHFRKLIDRSRGNNPSNEDALQNDQETPSFKKVLFPGECPTLKDAEWYLIQEALRRSNNNQNLAANLLGISRQALNHRLARKFPFKT